MYYWLKEGAEVQIEALRLEGKLGNVNVESRRNSGKQFIQVYEDPFDPTADLPEIPEEFVEKVTWQNRIYVGFRPEGVYRHDGAELLVRWTKNSRVVGSMSYDEHVERDEWQDINVSAPNTEALKTIYNMVRGKELDPDDDWETPGRGRRYADPDTTADVDVEEESAETATV